MNESRKTCLFLQVTHSTLTRSEQASAIAASTFGILTAMTATTGNVLVLFSFYKCRRLRNLPNILIASLCMTDFLTGAIVEPLFVIRRLHQLGKHETLCNIRLTFIFFANLCTGASLSSVGLVTMDRCIAITLPYRYYSNSHTATAYISLIIFSWAAWAMFTILPFIDVLTMQKYFIGIAITFISIILIVIISYMLIYDVVMKQRRKIATMPSFKITHQTASQQCRTNRPLEGNANRIGAFKPDTDCNISVITQYMDTTLHSDKLSFASNISCTNGNSAIGHPSSIDACRKKLMQKFCNFSKERHRANTIAIVIAALLICYLPQIILLTLRASKGDSRELILIDAWADVFVYINSTLNPVIYCLRNKDIRSAIWAIVRRKNDI